MNYFLRDKFKNSAIIRSVHGKQKARPKVTIAIGIISKQKRHPDEKGGQIILASDSQTTFPGGQKRLDSNKINIVRFANTKIIVAQAGSAELGDKAIEILTRKARSIIVENDETIPKAVEMAVREVRNHLMDVNRGCNFSDDGWIRFFRDENAFELLIGYYFEEFPHLCTVGIDWCTAIQVKHSFKAIGCGATLGEYLLKEYSEISNDFDYGEVIATDVVEKVIQNVDGCGSPTWVGIVRYQEPFIATGNPGYEDGAILPHDMKSDAFICRRQLIDSIAAELKAQANKSKAKASKQTYNAIISLCKKFGAMVYTESNDPDGDGGLRMSGFWKNKKDMESAAKKFTNRHKKRYKTS